MLLHDSPEEGNGNDSSMESVQDYPLLSKTMTNSSNSSSHNNNNNSNNNNNMSSIEGMKALVTQIREFNENIVAMNDISLQIADHLRNLESKTGLVTTLFYSSLYNELHKRPPRDLDHPQEPKKGTESTTLRLDF